MSIAQGAQTKAPLAAFRADPGAVAAEAMLRNRRRDAAFAAASVHSRRVRLLKRVIPIFCGLFALAGAVHLTSGVLRTPGQSISIDSLGLSGSKIMMQAPKLSGFKSDARAYEVVAESAAQDLKKPNVVELRAPVARIELENQGWARLSAASGVFDSRSEQFSAEKEVRVETDKGMKAELHDARVNFKAGTVETDRPVAVSSPQGTIAADGMRVFDHGKRIVFEGNVRSVFTAPPEEVQESAAAGPTAGLRGAR